ncbi:PKD domain-containing protein [Halorussus aquaticus]|uniref:PKD domain-containing protein n=1 Tax=Halorussus aquaticus TaxID=2953748 RepID=A0ABD5Q351_9EURY|nr:PKD domain-containing protein [Halorussus aquaticus]
MNRTVLATLLALFVVAAPVTGPVTAASTPDDAGNSSGPSQRWAKTVGGGDDDKLATGLKTDGGYLVVGWSNSSATDGKHDGYVSMLDRTGQTKWERTYGGPGTDRIYDVVQVEDGYLVAGMETERIGQAWTGWVMKLGPDGEKQWERTYDDSGPSALWSLTRSNGTLYVGGWQDDSGSAEGWLMELSPNGDEVWSETYETRRSGADEYVNSVFVTGNGELLLTGTTEGSSVDPGDAWVLRTDSGGELDWQRTYGGGEFDRVHDATAASDGGFVLAGRTASRGAGGEDGWLLKIRGDGQTQWQRTYGTAKSDAFFGIHDDPDGGYAVSGTKHVLGDSGADGWVLKTDSAGKLDWQRTYGQNYWDKFWPVVEGHGGGYLAVGESTSYGDNRDGWVVRVGGPAVAAVEDDDANESGTTVRFEDSPVQAVTLADSNVSGVLAVAERTDLSALSPPGDPLYAVSMNGSEAVTDGSATVEFAVQKSAVETDLSDVRVAQRTADGWSLRRTTVVSEANGTAILSAETEGARTLAVTSVPAPSASIDAEDAVMAGDTVELSASGSMAENATLTRYEWSVGERSATGKTATVSFERPGERTVNLTVTDENGLRDTATATLVVNDRPTVSVRTPDAATVGKASSFSANVSDDVGDVTVTWQFGGATVTGESVEHSFGSAGTKTVTVVVEDEYGATVTEEVQVEVNAQDAGGATTDAGSDTSGGVPGFGPGVSLVALLGAALLAGRLRG